MFFWNRKRKSRKQLLQEIEELKKEVIKQQSYKVEETLKLDTITNKIRTITATCISRHNEEEWRTPIQETLCVDLAKEMMPYVTFETYRMVGEPWDGESKHIATIHIVDC